MAHWESIFTAPPGGGGGGRNSNADHRGSSSTKTGPQIPRPQDEFNVEVDNSHNPFRPIITYKPNALVPLDLVLEKADKKGNAIYKHPYYVEIHHHHPDPDLLQHCDPREPLKLEETQLILVEELHQLKSMCQVIERENEIAVDLEHNSYRSYQGITCLLQISTRTRDYVIDTLKLRPELHLLNQSFTDPKIVKVFHGADNDILWLQRDFGVYVVNLFDTCRASKVMDFAHLSLAFLMEHYCNVETQKAYQLADWRERPLPMAMLNYARSDTHYLLYIYDRLRNDILNKFGLKKGPSQLSWVFAKGREICLKRYEKQSFSDQGYKALIKKWRYPGNFNQRQLNALQELYRWRDETSRKIDESPGYVLPNHHLLRIAQNLPTHPKRILSLHAPEPPLLKYFVMEILEIIHEVKGLTFDEDKLDPDNLYPCTGYGIHTLDLDESLHGHHDKVHVRDGFPSQQDVSSVDTMPVLLHKFQSASLATTNSGESQNQQQQPSQDSNNREREMIRFDSTEDETTSRLFGFMEGCDGNKVECSHHQDRNSQSSHNQRKSIQNFDRHHGGNQNQHHNNQVMGQRQHNYQRNYQHQHQHRYNNHHNNQNAQIHHQHDKNNQWRRSSQEQSPQFHPTNRDRVEKNLQSSFISPYQRYLSTTQQQQQQQ